MARFSRSSTALLLVLLSLASCGGTPEEKEARYIKKGEKLLDAGEYNKARVEFRNAAKIKPTDANVIYHLGLVDDAEGNFRDAYVSFTNAEQQDAHFHPALLKLAEYYLAGEQFAQASERIDVVLADDPNNAEARALLSARYLKQKNITEAESEAQKALKTDPDNVLAYGVLTGIYRDQNQTDKALQTIEEGIKRNPKSEALLRIRAEIYDAQGDLQKTVQSFDALIAAAPKERKYRIALANVYLKANQVDQAEATLRDGIQAMPNDWDMKRELIDFMIAHKDASAAEAELKGYIKDNPDKSEPVDWIVDLYLTHNMADKADSFLSDITSSSSHDQLWAHAMTARAKIDYLHQDLDKANHQIASVLEADPNNLNAQFIKAHIEADQGYYDQATIDLRGIIRDKPQAREAYDLLSEILLRQGHTDLAIDTLNQLGDNVVLTTAQQVRLAQLYALNGDSKHAKDVLLSATKTDPTYPIGWEMTARIALDQKDWQTADAAIETLDSLPQQHLTAQLLHAEELTLTGKYGEAIPVYISVIGTNPQTPQAEHALPALLRTYQAANQLNDGIKYLENLNGATPLIDTLLGQAYVVTGDTPKAAEAFDKAIASHIHNQEPYLERAKLYIANKKFGDALDLLRQAAEVDPSDMRAPMAEAQMEEQQENYSKALEIYTDLLNKHSDNNLVANNLAELIADHFNTDKDLMEKARQTAERFTATSNPLLLDTLGWVYFRQGHAQDAVAIFDRASGMSKELPPQFHYHYGAALIAAGNTPKAQSELQAATVNGADYPGHDEALKLFKGLPR